MDEVRDSLYTGRSGIVFSPECKAAGFRSALCADIPRPDLKPFVARNQRQFMPEETQYAYMATRQALENARLDAEYVGQHEVGLIYGNDSVAEATMLALDKFRQLGDTAACGSGAIFQSMNSTVTMNLACLFRLRGINLTASAACASGSHSVGLAYLLIREGLQECVVCGGAQEANLPDIRKGCICKYYSTERNELMQFVTNNFVVEVSTIALLYKYRWQIKLFFKWIEQNTPCLYFSSLPCRLCSDCRGKWTS